MELTKQAAAQLEDYTIDLAWAQDGGLAAAAASGPITLFDAAGNKRHGLPGHDDGSNCLAFAPASAILASGGQDGAVKFWDTASGQHTATASLGAGWVEKIAWRPGSASLAAACGKKLALLNSDGSLRHAFPDASKTISALAWSPSGPVLADAFFGAVRLWNVETLSREKEFPYANGIQALVWSPDGRWLVSGNQDPSVHLWMPAEGTELQMSGYEGKVRHLDFDHTSRWLATSGGASACLWDCSGVGPEGREPAMLPHEAPICALRYQNRHGLLATGGKDGTVNLWSPERKQPLRASARLPATPTVLAWSEDDRFLAIGSDQGAVYVLRCDA